MTRLQCMARLKRDLNAPIGSFKRTAKLTIVPVPNTEDKDNTWMRALWCSEESSGGKPRYFEVFATDQAEDFKDEPLVFRTTDTYFDFRQKDYLSIAVGMVIQDADASWRTVPTTDSIKVNQETYLAGDQMHPEASDSAPTMEEMLAQLEENATLVITMR